MKQKHRFRGYVVLGLIIISIGMAAFFLPGFQKLASPEFLRDYLRSLGPLGYLVYIILLLLSVPLPIPSTAIALAGGYVYGSIVGTVLTLLGVAMGATMVFYIVRRFGQSLVEQFVDAHHIRHFLHIFKRRGETAALISYAIPVFPSDAVNMVLGLTKVRYLTFLALVIVGSIPRYLIISSLGGDLYGGFSLRTIITILFCAVFLLIAVFREKVKRLIFTELKELEQEVEKEVGKVEKEVGKVEQEVEGMERGTRMEKKKRAKNKKS